MDTVTLTCESCGTQWERKRQRGRRPKQCPGCKASGATVINDSPDPSPSTTEPVEIDTEAPVASGETVYVDPEPNVAFERHWAVEGSEIDYKDTKSNTYYSKMKVKKKVVSTGDIVKIKGDSGTYQFLSLVEQHHIGDKFAVNLLGTSGSYKMKYRSVNPGRIK